MFLEFLVDEKLPTPRANQHELTYSSGAVMPSLGELKQHLAFIAAGIDDRVPYGDGSDPGADRCPECWWIWPDGAVRCAGCGFGSEASE